MNPKTFDFVFKVVIVGDSFVGKTTMLQNYIGNKEVGLHRHLAEKELQRNGRRVKLQIFDTMGQERYRSLTTSYYRGAQGCLICFDKRTTKSFENIQSFWMSDLMECIGKDIPKILVGINRKRRDSDGTNTSSGNQGIAQSEITSMSEQHRMPYMDVAMDNAGDINAVFDSLTDLIVATFKDYVSNQDPDIVNVSQGTVGNGRPSSCRSSC